MERTICCPKRPEPHLVCDVEGEQRLVAGRQMGGPPLDEGHEHAHEHAFGTELAVAATFGHPAIEQLGDAGAVEHGLEGRPACSAAQRVRQHGGADADTKRGILRWCGLSSTSPMQ